LKDYLYYLPYIILGPLTKLITIIAPSFKIKPGYKKFYSNGITFEGFLEIMHIQEEKNKDHKFIIWAINLDLVCIIGLIIFLILRIKSGV
jgi:hypothetical protein